MLNKITPKLRTQSYFVLYATAKSIYRKALT